MNNFIQDYTPGISIIIPTFNRANLLQMTLDSFIAQNYPRDKYEIIVVNNNSTDNTQEVVSSYLNENRGVKIIYLFEPRQGVHYARNKAAKRASFGILYYTDDDMIADPDLLKEIVRPFFMDDKVATVTGKVLPKWEKSPPKWVLDLCGNFWLSLHNRKEDLVISPDDCGVISCHQAIRRDIFFKAGGFNPENTAGEWMGDGETGLNIKIKDLGYKYAYIGSSMTYHMIPPNRMTQSYLNKRFKNQGSCDSYTAFKAHRYSKQQLCIQILKHIVKIPIAVVWFLLLSIYSRNSSWRLGIAAAYYFLQRARYDYKLIRSNNLRSFVLKYSWLDE